MVEDISNINRTLLDFKQALRFHKEILDSFEIVAKQFFGEKFSYYLTSIIGEYNKTEQLLDSNKEILDDLRDTNDSVLASKTRSTMKILTVITFLMMPIAILSDIFVINTKFLENPNPFNYYLVIGSMVFLCLIIFVITKAKKWF
jgi:Mg2+ and Co2+ transporter CorA